VKGIRSQARNTLGVRVIRLDEGDTVRDAVILEPPPEGLPSETSGEKAGPAKTAPEAPEPPAEDDEDESEKSEKKPGKDDPDSDDDTEDEDASPAQAR
jgi:hypothetical protein